MPPQQSKPDFIPAAQPDFIPAGGQEAALPEGVTRDAEGRVGSEAPPSNMSLYWKALTDPVGSGAHPQGIMGGAEQVGGQAIKTMAQPLIHPVDTAVSTIKAGAALSPVLSHFVPKEWNPANQAIDSFSKDKADEGLPLALENAGGQALGMYEGGRMAGSAGGKMADAIPTRAKAGALFNDVMSSAKDQPVSFTRSMAPMERAQQLSSAGHGTIGAVDKLYNRVNTVNDVPYGEARDYASALSDLTANDKMAATRSLSSQAKQLSHALNDDIGDAASRAGKGDEYAKAMKMYRRASQIRDAAKTVGKMAIPAAVAGGAGATGYKIYKAFQ